MMSSMRDTEPIDAHERARDYITVAEFDRLFAAAGKTRNPTRNQALLIMMFRHGLRCSEVCHLRSDDLSLETSHLWVRRLKQGLSTQHPIAGDELRVIRRYLRNRSSFLPWLFISERDGQLTRNSVYAIVCAAAKKAGLDSVHPHMLRHGCGFYLSNRGFDLRAIQDYLGHRDPKHTARYTRTAAARFNKFWPD